MSAGYDLMASIAAERRAFTHILEELPHQDWNSPSLCTGWRVREVVAHLTMPLRLSTPQFIAEMLRSRGNFDHMADRVARHDAQEPISTLLYRWRTNEDTRWKPPGGGLQGALTHDIVHGLDITIPLDTKHPVSDVNLLTVLDHATSPLSQKHFRLDLTGIRLEANDLDWAFGDGEPLRGAAHHLLMVLMNRRLPTGVLTGHATARFTTA
ncbi:maleylpyruvate isomerase family mycothiol-dependent enzyme [Arthrobacter sp. UYEF3]|uniref:maleylpyruvate isomerase family mycothiol-dependent enzyme n=1 Tax=Arthrobacter sp. UYEF3 TaxID=1756365 RepID=UPI0033908468